MQPVFYDEAAEILGVSLDTLTHAVARGELTRAGMQGNRRRLIKEQVLLFAGVNPRTGHKKRISYDSLSQDEQALWHRYAHEVNNIAPQQTTTDIEKLVKEQIREELARQELARIEEQKRDIASKEERFHKDYPFLSKREKAIA